MSSKENAASSEVVPVYSPGRSRKKKARQMMSAKAQAEAEGVGAP